MSAVSNGSRRMPSNAGTTSSQRRDRPAPVSLTGRLWWASPPALRRAAQQVIRRSPGRRVSWGTLRRTAPFSPYFGYERGTPVDRPAIEAFLDRHRHDVRGRVAEIKDGAYARRVGGDRVAELVIVDVDRANTQATLIADLCEPGSLPAGHIDCWIVTQTLQFVTDVEAALANLYQSLAPGGVLLLTVPALSRVDPASRRHDRWRFTPTGLDTMLRRILPDAEVRAGGHGNVLVAVAALMGLAAEELAPAELALDDPDFPVVAWARVAKPAHRGGLRGAPFGPREGGQSGTRQRPTM